MNYLLLGGAGFIGTHLAKSLRKDGHTITVIDNRSTSSNIVDADTVYIDDVQNMDAGTLEHAVADADVIYFLAGSVGVKNVVENPFDTLCNNVSLALVVVTMARQYYKPIIFTSTSEVYGDGPFVETSPLTIGSPDNLRWGYASAKLTTEFLIASSGCSHKILRLFNVTGPGQVGNYGMVLPRFIGAALADGNIEVYGSGQQTRTFLHVDDAIRMIRQVEQLPDDGIYNIGSDSESNNVTIIELAQLVQNIVNPGCDIVYRSLDNVYTANSGDVMNRSPDMTKVRSLIDYRVDKTITDIIMDMANDQCKY